MAVRILCFARHWDIFYAGYARVSGIFSGAFIRLDVENLVQINFVGLALEQRNPMVTDFSLDGKDNFSNSIYCPISTVIPDRAIP